MMMMMMMVVVVVIYENLRPLSTWNGKIKWKYDLLCGVTHVEAFH